MDYRLKEIKKSADKRIIQNVINAYKTLLENALNNNILFPRHGICKNVETLLKRKISADHATSFSYVLITHASKDWPLSEYPGIPSSNPCGWTHPLWKGEQLKLRVSLIRYIIRRLQHWLRYMEN